MRDQRSSLTKTLGNLMYDWTMTSEFFDGLPSSADAHAGLDDVIRGSLCGAVLVARC